IHTGNNVKILDNEGMVEDADGNSIRNGKDSLFIATGENCVVEASSGSVSFVSGKGAKLGLGFDLIDSDEPEYVDGVPAVENAILIGTGDKTLLQVTGSNSLGITTGEGAVMGDLFFGSTGIATGNNSAIVSEWPFKKAVILGDNSYIGGEGSDEFTAFFGGQQSTVSTGHKSSLLSEFPVSELKVGKDSVVVVGWHDGTRKRFSVYYEGEDFETFPEGIKEQPPSRPHGNPYPINIFKTTESGQLELLKVVMGTWG
ncbi:MAG: hypothetical protein ACTH64_17565, partial [Providencia sp.]